MTQNTKKAYGIQSWAILPTELANVAKMLTGPGGDVNPKGLVPDTNADWKSYMMKIGSTAVIHISGPLFYNILYAGTNIQIAMRDFQSAMDDKDIDLIVPHFHTPGGVLTGIREFSRMIYDARGKKKVIGYAQGLCASAGYYLYSACETRVADPMAMLGSVGVIFNFEDDSQYWENMGIKNYTVVSRQSPLKTLSPADPKGEKAYEDLATELCAEFISDVALYTGISPAVVESDFGQGFVLNGEKAVKAGMADEVGSMQDILSNRLTTLKGEPMGKENLQPAAAAAETETNQEAKTEQNGTQTAPTGKDTAKPTGDAGALEKKVDEVVATNKKMMAMLETVVAENKDLKEKNETLSTDNKNLKAENEELKDQPDKTETPKANGMSDGIERGY